MKQRLRHFIYFILLVLIDQISKIWAISALKDKKPISIIPNVLKLQYHENTGAAWGIMSDKTFFLIVFTIIILLLLIYIYTKIPMTAKLTSLKLIFVFIMAGAIGNFIDRVLRKYVVDFIYFELINFPIFNIADSYVSVSSVLLLLLAVFYYKDEDLTFLDQLFKKKKNNNE